MEIRFAADAGTDYQQPARGPVQVPRHHLIKENHDDIDGR